METAALGDRRVVCYVCGVRELIQSWPLADQAVAVALVAAVLVVPFLLVAVSKQLDRIIELLTRR
jgi:hypothetical protein